MCQLRNQFSFATEELSQDAGLCWGLAWADSVYASGAPARNQLGKDFISLCLDRVGRGPFQIEQFEVAPQVDNGYARAVMNGRYYSSCKPAQLGDAP